MEQEARNVECVGTERKLCCILSVNVRSLSKGDIEKGMIGWQRLFIGSCMRFIDLQEVGTSITTESPHWFKMKTQGYFDILIFTLEDRIL